MQFYKRWIGIFFLIPIFIYPRETVVHNVDVISGSWKFSVCDYVVQGAMTMPLCRAPHILWDRHVTEDRLSFMMENMGVYPHTFLYLGRNEDGVYHVQIVEPGIGITYYRRKKHSKNIIEMEYGNISEVNPYHPNQHKGAKHAFITNYLENPKNNQLTIYRKEKMAILKLADGTIRHYKKHGKKREWKDKIFSRYWKLGYRYRLDKEIAPNGEVTIYEYEGKNSITIKKVGPSSKKVFSWIHLFMEDTALKVSTSDGIELNYDGYHDRHQFYPVVCKREGVLASCFDYVEDPFYKRRYFSKLRVGHEQFRVEYYLPYYSKKRGHWVKGYDTGRIKEVYKKRKKVASFEYEKFCTKVRDAEGVLTKYFHKIGSLEKIERYDKEGKLYSYECFEWDDENLLAKKLFDGEDNLLQTTCFAYDRHKNLLEEITFMEEERYEKKYEYDENHLCIKEIVNGIETFYEYVEGTNLLSCKRTRGTCEYYTYDEDLLLIEKKVVAGDHERVEMYHRDPETKMIVQTDNGLDKIFYEFDEQKQLVKQSSEFGAIEYTYNQTGKVSTIFDMNTTRKEKNQKL